MTDRRHRQALMATNQDDRVVAVMLRSNVVTANTDNEPRHADENLLMMPHADRWCSLDMHLSGEQCRSVDNAALRSDRLVGILTASRGRTVSIGVESAPSLMVSTAAVHR